MRVYRYQIKPLSAFVTPMRSDTLYGQLLCAAAEREGETGVKALIKAFTDNKAPFVLSSAFPAGMLPVPVMPGIKRQQFKSLAHGAMFDTLSQYKIFRKKQFIPLTDWKILSSQLNGLKLFQYYRECTVEGDKHEKVKTGQSRTMHNSIDRNTNRVITQGGLYSDEARYFSPESRYDIYVKTANRTYFEELFLHVATTGFGADSSTGKGQFSFTLDDNFDDAIFNHKGNAAMSLSVCAAQETDQFSGTWNLFTKLGKVWNGFGESNPFKKPFIAFSEGSVFTTMPASNYVLQNIHSNPDYVQIGLPLTLPLTIEEDK